ncbi:uncharacterized protein HMPREF1541_04102 [Cyphellophora europaea CBS 101466]|uniref:Uncharacterized protein n=1 Tax=Cyphellophora europaea (strain CBS 101466) TaxID=1220924 RepID=W2S095_CYPE1|nr:uncharacterized protein HMPREF1541_04102 [Cyphellophora europaea CBS 101466]ETN42161.1 hypothetical protein HMPREF1541_04102 [Cyphellophora europaea CBS 101466]
MSAAANTTLHDKAQRILNAYQEKPTPSSLLDTLRELLTQIIKPLFSANPQPSLAPSGRKTHFAPAVTLPHSQTLVLDDSDKPWKLAFSTLTLPLLTSILQSYPTLPASILKPTLEQQIFLLTPALLNLIDDTTPLSKATGFQLLHHLSDALVLANSNILHPSGLTDVFIDAIKPNFMLLPSLTPEEDSLLTLRPLYPAYLSLVRARFQQSLPDSTPSQASHGAEESKRQGYLTLLLRHGLLASLAHLGAGTNTSHVELTTFLVAQVGEVAGAMGIYATAHLQRVLPLLRTVACDPFATSAPGLLLAALGAIGAVVDVAEERVRQEWWGEVLRACVGAWLSTVDDEEVAGVAQKQQHEALAPMKDSCRAVAAKLATLVDGELWEKARSKLVEEEPELEGLFALKEGVS